MNPAIPVEQAQAVQGTSLWNDAWKRFRRNRAAVVSGAIVLVIILISLLGPWLVYLYNGFEYDTLGLGNSCKPVPQARARDRHAGPRLARPCLVREPISLMVGLDSPSSRSS